jgi:hypothetical protein
MDRIEITEDARTGVQYLHNIRRAHPESDQALPNGIHCVSELFRVKDNSLFAGGADDLVITLEPTERLLELVATTRAGESKGNV